MLNLQPTIPVKVSENGNLISRIIQPIVWQPYPNQNTGGKYGLGDMNPTFFLSPQTRRAALGCRRSLFHSYSDKHDPGPGQAQHGAVGSSSRATAALDDRRPYQKSLVRRAGSEHRPPVNQMLLQYILNYNRKKGWYLQMAPIITANWRATSGNMWTVPVVAAWEKS